MTSTERRDRLIAFAIIGVVMSPLVAVTGAVLWVGPVEAAVGVGTWMASLDDVDLLVLLLVLVFLWGWSR